MQQAAETTREAFCQPNDAIDPQAWRRQWFATLSQTTDAYLRSPVFLQMLKHHIDSLIAFRQASDRQPAAESEDYGQFTEDVRAIQSKLNQLQRQLKSLEQQHSETSDFAATVESTAAADEQRQESETPRGATPFEVVCRQGNARLLRYRSQAIRFAEPVLICFALVNRPWILDLQVDRSVVRRLLERGFDVYLIDWGVPGTAEQAFRLDDYVGSLLHDMSAFTCRTSGASQLNLLGYCMGGTMSTIYTAIHQKRVRNLILMATPIDFGGDEGLLNLWTRADVFDVDGLIDAFGNCPGELLQFVFQLMKPVQNFAEKQLRLSENLDDTAFVDNFVAVERWANDTVPVVGETFRQYVKALYQRNQLVNGSMTLAGRPVRLSSITCPLLLLVAEKDHLVPTAATLALQQHVSSVDIKSLSINAGHVGLAVSSKAHRQLWPEAANWIAMHSTERN